MNDFIPVKILFHRKKAWIEWRALGVRKFQKPFFDQSIADLLKERPSCPIKLTPLPLELPSTSCDASLGGEPTGLIFHSSRCGSTLLAQMLNAVPGTRVISEAGILNTLLRYQLGGQKDRRVRLLRYIIRQLAGSPPISKTSPFFIKFSSWNAIDLPLITQAFPNTPWIFLYRNPAEVLASVFRQPSGWLRAKEAPQWAARLAQTSPEQVEALNLEEYACRVLAHFLTSALNATAENAFFLNYRQLPEAAWNEVARHFQWLIEDIDAMREAACYDSKNSEQRMPFIRDESPQPALTEGLAQRASAMLSPLYRKLEERHMAPLKPGHT